MSPRPIDEWPNEELVAAFLESPISDEARVLSRVGETSLPPIKLVDGVSSPDEIARAWVEGHFDPVVGEALLAALEAPLGVWPESVFPRPETPEFDDDAGDGETAGEPDDEPDEEAHADPATDDDESETVSDEIGSADTPPKADQVLIRDFVALPEMAELVRYCCAEGEPVPHIRSYLWSLRKLWRRLNIVRPASWTAQDALMEFRRTHLGGRGLNWYPVVGMRAIWLARPDLPFRRAQAAAFREFIAFGAARTRAAQ
jgi:hypothetical protein